MNVVIRNEKLQVVISLNGKIEHEVAVTCGISALYENNYWEFNPELKL